MRSRAFGIAAAVLFHAAVLLFGGIFFLGGAENRKTREVREVDLVDPRSDEQDPKEDLRAESEASNATERQMQETKEAPPDMTALLDGHEAGPTAAPALEALSLGEIESLLNPGAGGGGESFGSYSLSSGGRIGGTGAPGARMEAATDLTAAFDAAELDQKPRPLFQAQPRYPSELRQRKTPGTVTVVFVVDSEGRVVNPRVESSTNQAFDAPALTAVRQWRFEPAVRDGQKVKAKLRIPIRFEMS